MEEKLLPKFDYYLDESDPDIVVLRRQDGAFVAAFSARGATREGIVEVVDDTPAGKDFLSCGSGFDRVLADRLDVIAPDCERVFFGERNLATFYASPPDSFWDAQPVPPCVTCRR